MAQGPRSQRAELAPLLLSHLQLPTNPGAQTGAHRQLFKFAGTQLVPIWPDAPGEDALSPTNPYHSSKIQSGDITFGNKNVLWMVAQAAVLGQKGAYYHKWLVHRKLRPEVFGGRVQNHLSQKKSQRLL